METEYKLIELLREIISRIEEIEKIHHFGDTVLIEQTELRINILTHVIRFTENTLERVKGE